MREGFRQSMAWLHTWTGLVVCWVLFMVFFAGTVSYYRDEITLWMQPELHAQTMLPIDSLAAGERAVAAMQKRAPNAATWYLSLPQQREPNIRALWSVTPRPTATPATSVASAMPATKPGKLRFENAAFSPLTGEKIIGPRETGGGDFLFRLHFELYGIPTVYGRWFIGICAMLMLVAIISGVITHKRIFKDFFTFRRGKGQRSWLDAHNVTAVLALPFHLMITYTGLVTLMFLYMPWGAQVAYSGNRDQMVAEVFQQPARGSKAANIAEPLTPVRPLMQQAIAHWGEGSAVGKLTIEHPNDANATILISRAAARNMGSLQPAMLFNGVSGALVRTIGDDTAGASAARSVMYSLHLGRFADSFLRALFFLSGLAGCVMVASGALLWAVKIRTQQAKRIAAGEGGGFGLRLVEGLNIGAIAGLPIALGAYFWANRLLPVVMDKRVDMEIRCFFIAWAISIVIAQIRPTRMMWRIQLWLGAALLAGIPLLNAATTRSHLGVTLFSGKGPAAVAGFDLVALFIGILLACAAWRLRGAASKKSRRLASDRQDVEPAEGV